MTSLNQENLSPPDYLKADICICGGGPAGLTVASGLGRLGYQVVVLESGYEKLDPEVQPLNDLESVGQPLRENFFNRLRALGGSSNIWSGRCAKLDPIDFEKRDWVTGSGWPIDYGEYSRYLGPAAKLLGLPAELSADKASDDRTHGFEEQLLACGIQPGTALWARAPARFWRLLGPELAQAGNCRVFSGTTVTGLEATGSGEAINHVVGTRSGESPLYVQARLVVLAMGGLENVRTLLLAAERSPHIRLPRATLGRYFMDHPKTTFGSIKIEDFSKINHWVGRRPVEAGIWQVVLGLTPEVQRRDQLLNAHVNLEPAYSDKTTAGYSKSIEALKRLLKRGHPGKRLDVSNLNGAPPDLIYQLTPEEVMPFTLFRALHGVRRLMQQAPRRIVLVNHCEQVPDPNSRITLGSQRDRFGNRLLQLDWRASELEKATLVDIQRRVGDLVEKLGAGALETDPSRLPAADFTDAAHHMGGTRMSQNACRGVVNSDLKVHGLHNLYVCGSSVFPTGGSANPTLTIVALALRLVDHLDAVLRR
jgi:choline dehydrogenase-like flavoprotein